MNESDPIIQKTVQRAGEIRKTDGYCLFQSRDGDGTLYCRYLTPYLNNPHAYCPHLTKERIRVVERGQVGVIRIVEYFKSDFTPKVKA